jgi:transcriptional regulator with XRE-family HTH domain
LTLGLSQAAIATAVGWSQQHYSRFERDRLDDLGLVQLSTLASVLGLEPSVTLYPTGLALRDKGHEALISRLLRVLSPSWHVSREVLFPNPGDPRSWDLLLRLPDFRLGVEAETRIRDLQALVRRLHERDRDGGAAAMLLVLSDSAHNRRAVADLRLTLGRDYASPATDAMKALRQGVPLQGSAVILL